MATEAQKPRKVTSKQRKLAKLIASGVSKKLAYETAYDVRPGGSANAHKTNGHQVSRQPAVAALIREYEEQLLPLGDIRAEQEAMLAHIKEMAYQAQDERTRLAAAAKFVELLEIYGERQERRRLRLEAQAPQREPVEAIVDELLALSAPAAVPIELEVENSGTIRERSAEPEPELEDCERTAGSGPAPIG